ncbi:MAG: iron-containing alcohol dehydrogenase [Candidatus Omnitrophica bacterium]|nr:iron-containing alcohol dehydrogenase [Candidatus Omnitrophota bacterium]
MKIESKIKNYSVEKIEKVLSKKEDILKNIKFRRVYFFIDENVFNIYKKSLKKIVKDDQYLIIPADETNKEYIKLADYYKWLIDEEFMRTDILITIGGGILQDISGFIASTLYRGIKWIFIPTTLLSQADSCIGSKTSINFKGNKNLIGSFYPPDRIFIDPAFCHTLSDEYFNSGIGEIIKFHLLSDMKGYEKLKDYIFSKDLKNEDRLFEMIISTLKIKKSYFDEDEFDTGRRNLLNYGHCFGHALESASNYAICHGEAVLLGMAFADLLSLKRKILSQEVYDEFQKIYYNHYPDFNIKEISSGQIIKYLKKDKKRIGKYLTMVISKGVGNFEKLDDIKDSEIKNIYRRFISDYLQRVD